MFKYLLLTGMSSIHLQNDHMITTDFVSGFLNNGLKRYLLLLKVRFQSMRRYIAFGELSRRLPVGIPSLGSLEMSWMIPALQTAPSPEHTLPKPTFLSSTCNTEGPVSAGCSLEAGRQAGPYLGTLSEGQRLFSDPASRDEP